MQVEAGRSGSICSEDCCYPQGEPPGRGQAKAPFPHIRGAAANRRLVMRTMEKRQNPRYPIEAPAVLHVEGRPGPLLVTLLDVSSAGLRLSSPVALPQGTKVGIKCLSRQMSGEIRYSRPMEASGFNIGVQVESVSGSTGEFDLVSLFRRS
jgi:hypothetical protein